MDEGEFLKLVGRLYEVPGDEAAWPGFITEFARALDSDHGHLLLYTGPNRVQWGATKAGADDANTEYQRDYARGDRRTARLFRLADGEAKATTDLMTADEIRRDPLHQEFLAKYDVAHMLAAKSPLGDGRYFLSSVLRSRRYEYTPEEYHRQEQLHPHIRNALRLHLQLLQARGLAQSFEAGLDLLPGGIVLLGANGAVLFANRAARTLLDARDGIRLEQNRLSANLAADRTALQAALARALGKTGPALAAAALVLRATGRPLALRMTPISAHIDLLAHRAAAIVLINDPDRVSNLLPESLAMFGFTPAESRLAVALAAGGSLETYAQETGLSVNTVRSTLKTLFDKTDTHRQGELISLILRANSPV